MLKCLGFILFLSLITFHLNATNFDLLKCDQFTIDDGLPQSFIESIFQDSKGYLWISTQDGISRYNGYEFENFFSNPFDSSTILSNYVIGMDNWNSDSVCFTTKIGISIYDPTSKKFKNFPFALNNPEVGSITSSLIHGNQIIISTSKGLFNVDLNSNKAAIKKIDFNFVVKKVISFQNNIFFNSDSILYKFEKNAIVPVKHFNKKIQEIFSNGGEIIISFKNKLVLFDKGLNKINQFDIPSIINDCVIIDNKYWLGTEEHGLIIFDPKNKKPLNWYLNDERKHTLLSIQIRCIFKDNFGVIWLGTDKGINKVDLSKQQFLQYKASHHNKLANDNSWSFWEDDSLFISGYDNGIQIHDKILEKHSWLPFDGLILDIAKFQDTIILATSKGVYNLGIKDSSFVIDTIALDIIYKEKQDIAFKFFQTNGKLLIGSLNYLSLYNENFKLTRRWNLKNVRAFTKINNNVYFAAYPSGIHRLININDENRLQIKSTPLKEVEHLLTLSIGASQDNNIWLGLYGGGVIKFEPGTQKTTHFSTKDGLPNNTIYSISPSKKYIWFSTNGGLSRLDINNEEFENYNTSDGLQSLEFNSGAVFQNNNKIYFGGINGYNIVDLKKENKNTTKPKVYIASFRYKKENLLKPGNDKLFIEDNIRTITIPHKRNNFEIIVDALHYSSPKENLFRTKLEGWQNDWTISKGKRIFKFSNLKDGEYTFLVSVANSDQVWSYEEEKIKIIIKPPFYLTWWFITGVSVFLGSIIANTIYSRINRSKSQREILEKKVRDRTREVENQKIKLIEKNKELEEEKNKEEEVLLNVLPRQTAKELVSTGKSTPKSYKMATVMFADFKNFTKITENLGPKELVYELDDSFAKFDDIVGQLKIEKIKTSGDAYMCVGGVPIRNKTNPIDCVLAALQFQKYMRQKREIREGTGKPQWHLRIGMHTGGLVAGVVGKRKFLYDVWGDTVNTASRMETSAEQGTVNVSGTTYEYIKEYFDCEYRGKLPVKNKGAIDMYYIKRIKFGLCKDESGETPNSKFFELLNFNIYTKQNFNNIKDYFIDLLEHDKFVSKLKYHGPHHTVDVMAAAERIGISEGLSEEEIMLVKVAALFHDSGFLNKYLDNESEGAKLAKRELPRYGFTNIQVEIVEGMILATRIPQNPKTHLEKILCDADLDYLGRDKNEFDKISSSLAQELIEMKILKSIDSWDPIQVKFLEMHKYYTKTCIQERRPGKIERLREIKDRLKGPNME